MISIKFRVGIISEGGKKEIEMCWAQIILTIFFGELNDGYYLCYFPLYFIYILFLLYFLSI